jgi:hypothetical protein
MYKAVLMLHAATYLVVATEYAEQCRPHDEGLRVYDRRVPPAGSDEYGPGLFPARTWMGTIDSGLC